jgi:hypothetical protein
MDAVHPSYNLVLLNVADAVPSCMGRETSGILPLNH